MDQWDEIDLLGAAHITFSGKTAAKMVFIALEADLDVRYGSRDGAACAEFSWKGFGDGNPAVAAGLSAHRRPPRRPPVFIHKGDDSGYVAERE
jgi:hypothetical protein